MSRFTAHLGLRLAERADGAPELTADGRCCWLVAAPLAYEVGALGSGETITVPSGATTDLASIPRLAWSIGYPPDGPWLKAAVVHDFLYRTRGTGWLGGQRWLSRRSAYSRAEADAVLREAMAALSVGPLERAVIWTAVRLGGAGGWGR